jgi:hypothetical protein
MFPFVPRRGPARLPSPEAAKTRKSGAGNLRFYKFCLWVQTLIQSYGPFLGGRGSNDTHCG